MDAYAHPEGMLLWLKTEDGRNVFAIDPHFSASVHVDVSARPQIQQRIEVMLRRLGIPATFHLRERHDIFARTSRTVLAITPRRLIQLGRLTRALLPLDLPLFDADIPLPTRYCYERRLFPCGRVAVTWERMQETTAARIAHIEMRDDRWTTSYDMPPLSIMQLRFSGPGPGGSGANPRHGYRHLLEMRTWNRGDVETNDARAETRILEAETPRAWAELFSTELRRHDPDIILTNYGDDVLFPTIFGLTQSGPDHPDSPIPWDRGPGRQALRRRKPAHSYFTYGKLIYTSGSTELIGRWHIDRKNSFWMDDMGLEAVIELARISRMPVQPLSRASIGTVLSSMQLAEATTWDALIPVQKMQIEDWKTGEELLTTDKGGLVFQPLVGLHEDVIEFDFASMYPNIMVKKNISAETINCTCCGPSTAGTAATPGAVGGLMIPELRKWSCLRTRGIVGATLAPLVEKRSQYKVIAKHHPDPRERARAKRCADAHKWLMVCCFGYLGYKNARFGKIEAHEAVTAWGREVLLTAKEIIEKRGYRLLHAIVDSLWIKREDGSSPTDAEVEVLRREIEQATSIPLGYEGRYRWILFCRSRVDERTGVANRYVGAFETGHLRGDLKIRGLETRRHDTSGIVRAFQQRALELLSQAIDVRDFHAHVAPVLELLLESVLQLVDGDVTAHDLAITTRVSKSAADYQVNTVQAAAIKELAERGHEPTPGDLVQYIITDRDSAVPAWKARSLVSSLEGLGSGDGSLEYDQHAYTRLLCRAADTVLHACGWDEERLYAWILERVPVLRPKRLIKANAKKRAQLMIPLFSPTQ